jgi:hypothetical protein
MQATTSPETASDIGVAGIWDYCYRSQNLLTGERGEAIALKETNEVPKSG